MRLLPCSIVAVVTACASPKDGAQLRDSARHDSVDTPAAVRTDTTRDTAGVGRARPDSMPKARRDSASPMPNAKVPTPAAGKPPAPPSRVVPDPVLRPRDSASSTRP